MVSTTIKKRYKIFKDYFKEAVEFIGLHTYQFEFELDQTENSYFRAQTRWHNMFHPAVGGSRHITIKVSSEWLAETVEENDIRVTAWHEALEVLMSRLSDMASNNEFFVSDPDVAEEVHKVIRLFENKVLPLIKNEAAK